MGALVPQKQVLNGEITKSVPDQESLGPLSKVHGISKTGTYLLPLEVNQEQQQ